MAAKKKAQPKKSSSKMNGLTPAQKKLPPFLQSAILKKKKSGKK